MIKISSMVGTADLKAPVLAPYSGDLPGGTIGVGHFREAWVNALARGPDNKSRANQRNFRKSSRLA